MQTNTLKVEDLEPRFEVRKLDDNRWLVKVGEDRDCEIETRDQFYHCTCNQPNEPPWTECEHVLAVQQYELQQLEQDMAAHGLKAFADSLLWQIAQLESEMQRNDQSADHQIKRIELWRKAENRMLQKRIKDKAILLYNYMQNSGKRTENLVNGTVRLRKQQPRITVTEAFDLNQADFVRIVPAQRKPDLRAIRKHLKETGEVLTGVEVEMQPDNLSWETNTYNAIGGNNESDESTLRKAG